MKFTKEDFKANSYNIKLIIIYSIILGVVYGFWMYKSDIKIVFDILVGFAFLLVGVIIMLLYINHKAKKRIESESKENLVM